jgi:hypothetical protein
VCKSLSHPRQQEQSVRGQRNDVLVLPPSSHGFPNRETGADDPRVVMFRRSIRSNVKLTWPGRENCRIKATFALRFLSYNGTDSSWVIVDHSTVATRSWVPKVPVMNSSRIRMMISKVTSRQQYLTKQTCTPLFRHIYSKKPSRKMVGVSHHQTDFPTLWHRSAPNGVRPAQGLGTTPRHCPLITGNSQVKHAFSSHSILIS